MPNFQGWANRTLRDFERAVKEVPGPEIQFSIFLPGGQRHKNSEISVVWRPTLQINPISTVRRPPKNHRNDAPLPPPGPGFSVFWLEISGRLPKYIIVINNQLLLVILINYCYIFRAACPNKLNII